jgi:hypothetical protein
MFRGGPRTLANALSPSHTIADPLLRCLTLYDAIYGVRDGEGWEMFGPVFTGVLALFIWKDLDPGLPTIRCLCENLKYVVDTVFEWNDELEAVFPNPEVLRAEISLRQRNREYSQAALDQHAQNCVNRLEGAHSGETKRGIDLFHAIMVRVGSVCGCRRLFYTTDHQSGIGHETLRERDQVW